MRLELFGDTKGYFGNGKNQDESLETQLLVCKLKRFSLESTGIQPPFWG